MDVIQAGPLQVAALGGSDRKGRGDGAAVLLCHGFGAAGDDLVSLARVVDAGREVRWFFPEAPLELDFGSGMTGRAWWPLDMVRLQTIAMRGDRAILMQETPDGLSSAREKLEACIESLEKTHGVRREALVIGGFSQGAMLSTEIALHAAKPFAGLAVLSGCLLSADRWRVASATSGPKLDVFMSHGRADSILPFDGAIALHALLEASGARVDWVPHGGGHEIPSPVLDRLAAFLRARFA